MEIQQTWRVGALAKASGLTVRTLHHWDQIGLLSPSRRTASGHREYGEPDVVRLYQVLVLRRLGLGLDSIAVCLDAGVDPVRLVGDHLAGIERSIAALDELRQRLVHIHQHLLAEREPDISMLIAVLRSMGGPGLAGTSEAVRQRLAPDQLAALRENAATLGPAAHYLLEIEWPELYRRAEALRVSGIEPGTPQVQKLVRRMDELSVLFSGGDTRLSGSVRTAWREELADTAQREEGDVAATAGAWRDLADYLDQARAAP
ncbi:MerR family transcriptional regulator, thiopeptide resistance regulator [Frankia sp. AiPs1]|uniref:MerR family DNA-binding transcriptional regulator n=1 Tax=Frankia sp. AiPa1 TaxID=573492 RepID=UPI00202AD9CF|nr:MerR family DNA-binding transcriptional regulator [Frankia sp. AiPa1]MCL9760357.1 MerR family DNA-binding transcriptional regulator [Frankia sp. AiPa1]